MAVARDDLHTESSSFIIVSTVLRNFRLLSCLLFLLIPHVSRLKPPVVCFSWMFSEVRIFTLSSLLIIYRGFHNLELLSDPLVPPYHTHFPPKVACSDCLMRSEFCPALSHQVIISSFLHAIIQLTSISSHLRSSHAASS